MVSPRHQQESHEKLRGKSHLNFSLFGIVVLLVPLLLLVFYWDRIMPLVRVAYEGQARADRTAQANERSLQALRDSASSELRQNQQAAHDLGALATPQAPDTARPAPEPNVPVPATSRASDQGALEEMKRSGAADLNSFR